MPFRKENSTHGNRSTNQRQLPQCGPFHRAAQANPQAESPTYGEAHEENDGTITATQDEKSAPATRSGVRGTPEGAAPTPAATDSQASVAPSVESSPPEIGPHGPIFREYHRDAPGAVDRLLAERTGEAPGALWHPDVPGEDIDLNHGAAGDTHQKGFGLAKIARWRPEVLDDLQGHLMGMEVDPEKTTANSIQLQNGPYRAVVWRDWKGDPKTWLLREYKTGEGIAGESVAPSAGRTIDVPGTHGDGRQATQPGGSDSSLAPASPASQAQTPAISEAQRIEDAGHEHVAYLAARDQNIEWSNRQAQADLYAGYLTKNKLDPTPENIANAARVLEPPPVGVRTRSAPV